MRKTPRELENPFENVLIDITEILLPYFKKWNFTPNILTTFGLVTGLVSAYFLNQRGIILFVVLYILSYFFDVADGLMARKYKMVSKFGDLYDHASDIIKSIVIIYVLYNRYKMTAPWMSVIIGSWVLSSVHLGCQEKLYTKNSTSSLEPIRLLCPNPTKMIPYSRWFGPATSVLILVGVALTLHYSTGI